MSQRKMRRFHKPNQNLGNTSESNLSSSLALSNQERCPMGGGDLGSFTAPNWLFAESQRVLCKVLSEGCQLTKGGFGKAPMFFVNLRS